MRAALILLVIPLAGCGIDLKQSYPDRRYYDLHVVRPASKPAPAERSVLKVRRLRISPRCEGAGLVTRTGESTFESNYYHLFFSPPASMLTEEARTWLAGAGLFGNVVDFGSTVDATHLVEGSVAALHGDVRPGLPPRAVIELQLFLIDQRPSPPTVAFRKDYRREIPVASPAPADLVKGWTEALAQIFAEFEADLAKVK